MFFPNTACLFLIYLPQWALGWPKGAPSGACSTLTPNHGASPQNTVSPYMIKAEPMGEGLVQLTVRGTSGAANPFRGFMIQAKDKSGMIIGHFDLGGEGGAKYLECEGGSRDTLTHNSRDAKDSLTFKWMAPEDFSDLVHFQGSIVEAKLKYWTNIRSETLDLKNGNSGAASEGVASTRMGFVMAAAVVAAFKRWAMP